MGHTPSHYYPVFLELHGHRVLVVGGGVVAERKVAALLEAGAQVCVVSPEVTGTIAGWAEQGRITIERRHYRPGDLHGCRLAFAATDDPGVNEAVRSEAESTGVWLNVADRPALCDFIAPAVARQGDLAIAISTGGASPAMARRIREVLEHSFGPEYATTLDRLRALREQSRAEGRGLAEERERFEHIVDSVLPATSMESDPQDRGRVFLVGAGPGDPGLLTLKGKRCLETADVVVYDALAEKRLLDLCRPDATVIYVGKRDGVHSLPQEEINAILVREARAGRKVVRLKGGDPFVFGRGGEEAQALAEAGISFEVVPGVTAGSAVPAYAGIPLTHRDITSEVTFVTGHERSGKDSPAVQWDRLARSTGTLVVFMGLHNLTHIVQQLLLHGKDPQCPAAVIQCGTTPQQRTATGVLADIVERVKTANLEPPALIVVGDVVRLRQVLQWYLESGWESAEHAS
ncbi:MAG: siroheme synthase CysG [Acidobacteriota bacterium]